MTDQYQASGEYLRQCRESLGLSINNLIERWGWLARRKELTEWLQDVEAGNRLLDPGQINAYFKSKKTGVGANPKTYAEKAGVCSDPYFGEGYRRYLWALTTPEQDPTITAEEVSV